MNIVYESLSPTARLWAETAVGACTYPLDRLSLDVTIAGVDEPPCEGHQDLMCTQVTGAAATVSVRLGIEDPAHPMNAGLPNPQRDTQRFFVETVIHEIGHVVSLFLLDDDAKRTTAAGLFRRAGLTGAGMAMGTLPDWNPLDRLWEERIQEAVAEVFKDAYLPSGLRVYDNRTHWALDKSRFPEFFNLLLAFSDPNAPVIGPEGFATQTFPLADGAPPFGGRDSFDRYPVESAYRSGVYYRVPIEPGKIYHAPRVALPTEVVQGQRSVTENYLHPDLTAAQSHDYVPSYPGLSDEVEIVDLEQTARTYLLVYRDPTDEWADMVLSLTGLDTYLDPARWAALEVYLQIEGATTLPLDQARAFYGDGNIAAPNEPPRYVESISVAFQGALVSVAADAARTNFLGREQVFGTNGVELARVKTYAPKPAERLEGGGQWAWFPATGRWVYRTMIAHAVNVGFPPTREYAGIGLVDQMHIHVAFYRSVRHSYIPPWEAVGGYQGEVSWSDMLVDRKAFVTIKAWPAADAPPPAPPGEPPAYPYPAPVLGLGGGGAGVLRIGR